ncbi:hypothetical protein LR48_Vigan08g078300 [Vigna angularis]|uniref:Putative plant transposon protein domain-containing protein n=1 Tax=Phaseolus angularis TaxID=3914 RepID=A0A0L9V4P5_PHAAN|nr:hypothetical protein LR48_Vigan08g078300 [Vigna angularis]
MSISDTGVIRSEVKGVKIRVCPKVFNELTSLPSASVRYEGGIIDEWKEHYDSVSFRQLVCRDDAHIQGRILEGQMKVQHRILHYVLTRVLIPHATNIGQASEEDIMLLWALFNSMEINWGHLIRYRMKRALKDNARLPYPYWITIFLEHFQVPTETDPCTQIKAKQRMENEVICSFGYVQNQEGVWVPKENAPNQERQGRQQEDNEEVSSSTTLNDVINRIEELQTFVGTRFGNMDIAMRTRFDSLESRVSNIEDQLQHLRTRFDNEPRT